MAAVHLFRQLAVVDPKIIVLMGKVASWAVLDREVSVSQEHGEIIKKGDKTFLITFHPAAAMRFPKIRKEFTDDFRKLKGLLTKKRAKGLRRAQPRRSRIQGCEDPNS